MKAAVVTVVAAVVWAAAVPAWAQRGTLRDIGQGPSTGFFYRLPSNNINRTLGNSAGYMTSARFFDRPAPQSASYLASPNINVFLQRNMSTTVTPQDLAPGPGLRPLTLVPVRSIDSLNFAKRGRFTKLKETMMALADRAKKTEGPSVGQLRFGFREFMFPFPLVDQPEVGYGFFSRTDLVGGGTVKPDVFLAPFTDEVQQSLGEPAFLDLMEALLAGRPPAKGPQMEQLYDTQLAALGNHLFNNGRYATAAQAWKILADRDPTNATARRAYALCLLAAGEVPQAAAEVRRSLVLARGWPDKVLIVGSNLQDVFRNPDDLADVRAEIEAQLARKSDDADLKFLLAFVDLFQGRWPEAQDRLAKLAAADEVARNLLAVMKRGGVAETIRQPTDPNVARLAADMTGLEEPALSPEARAELINALRNGPQSFEDHMRLGDFRFFMGDFTLASESYRAAHKARPQDPFALFAMTHAAYANGEYRQALRCLEKALAIEPGWGLFEFRLQEFYGSAEEYDRHLRNLERQVEIRSGSADLKFLLAYIYYFSGRYGDATDLLAEVLHLEPGFERATYFLRLARLQG